VEYISLRIPAGGPASALAPITFIQPDFADADIDASPDAIFVTASGAGGDIFDASSATLLVDSPLSTIDALLESAVALSPDGTRLAARTTGGVTVFDTATNTAERTISAATVTAYSPDGSTFACAVTDFVDNRVEFRAVDTGYVVATVPLVEPVWALAFSQDGHELAAGTASGRIVRIDAMDRHQIGVLNVANLMYLSGIQYSNDGALVAIAGIDGDAQVLRISDGALVHTTNPLPHSLGPTAFLQTTTEFVEASDSGLATWNTADWTPTGSWPVTRPFAVASQPGSSAIAVSAISGLQLFGSDGSLLQQIAPGSAEVDELQFSRDGRTLAAYQSGFVQLFCQR
jgi:WD40 repeat protein